MRSDEYCCYCLTPKGEKFHCCSENHFLPFDDLYEEDQAALLEMNGEIENGI